MRQSHLRTAVISPWGLPLCFVTSLEIFISRILISPCHTGKDSEMIKGMNSRDFCATEALLHFTAPSVTGSAWLGSESPVPLWKSPLRSLDTQPFLGSAEPILSLPDLRLGLSTSVFSTFRFWRNWWWGHCWHFLFPFPWSLRDLKQKKKNLSTTSFYTLSPQFTACFDTKVSQGNLQKYFQNQFGKHKPCRFLIPLRICLFCQNAFLLCD